MQEHATPQRTVLKVSASALAGLVVGFALGAAAGWPPLQDSQPEDSALALMCTALDDLDTDFLQSMADDQMAFRTSEDRRMTASLMAAIGYAEVAAQASDGDDALLETAQDLREAMQRIQGDVAREHVDELQAYC